MIKKIILATILFSLLFVPFQAYASDGLVKPNSHLYFLQIWGEQLKLLFAGSSEKQFSYLLELTDRRVDEMTESTAYKVTSRYERHYQKLSELSVRVQNRSLASEKVKEANLTQQRLLAEVYVTASDQDKGTILGVQETSSEYVAKVVEMMEGSQAAQEYLAKTSRIHQKEKIGQLEQINKTSMEDSLDADPSKSVPNELRESNSLQEGKSLNPLNSGKDTEDSGSGNKMEQAKPAQMNKSAGQN